MRSRAITPGAARWKKPMRNSSAGRLHITQRHGGATARPGALGYASIFVTDHIVLPASMARSVYPYSATRQLPGGAAQDYLEPLALLGALARETKRAWLGTSVLVIPYRHPLVTAKIL